MTGLNNPSTSLRVKKKILIFVLGIILFAGFFSFARVLHVQAAPPQTTADALGLTQVGDATALGKDDIRVTIAKIIRIFLGLLGIIALGIMLYGGFVYMTAGGDDQKVSMAKKIMINGAIGLVIIFSSFAITQFVLNKLAGATGFMQGSVPANCADPVYAAANPGLCSGGGFNPCENLDNQFVVKSITPITPAASTGMNNFAVRVIFSQPIAGAADNEVFSIKRDSNDVTGNFNFSFVDGNMAVVEASSPTAPNGVWPQGNYAVTVLSTLTSSGGLNLETDNVCGSFPSSGSFSVTTDNIVDSQVPTVSAITYNGLTYGGAAALPRGRTYRIASAITDNSGAGYVHLEVQRRDTATNVAVGASVVFYDGPRVTRGSQATAADPYNFSYNFLVSSNTPVYNEAPNSYFTVTLKVTDIDHNVTTVTSDFIVVENTCAFGTGEGAAAGCRGNGSCMADMECLSGVCNETTGQCVIVPLISDVSPWTQAGGSWATITGSSFGSNEGKVSFGRDTNADGDPDAWVPATIVSCGGSNVWHDNYVIVEVPKDNLTLPDLSLSSVRLEHAVYDIPAGSNLDFYDETTNNRGPLPGPNVGWFTKDNSLNLPGLCSIVPPQGLSGTPVVVNGQNLGAGGTLAFGNIAAVTGVWNNTSITATVPDNMSPGFVGVVATVGGQQSNGVPFRIMSEAELTAPVIESVTPGNTTVGSYATISGKRFGDNPGYVYLAPDTNTACLDFVCLKTKTHTECLNPVCAELTTTLPDACGDTWNSEQIIAQVPAGVSGQKVVIVQNEFSLQSVPGTADRLNIVAGGPMPSICALSPAKGMAPLETGNLGLNITGINFSAAPKIYFWGQQSVIDNNLTWLALSGARNIVGGVETILTKIPVDYDSYSIPSEPTPFDSGFSMASGPIKIRTATNEESNSVKYAVADCREISKTLWPAAMRCCSEGPSAGNFIHDSFACPGEKRAGGYVWRFTTGRIAELPRVLEECNGLISPTPWRYQGNGGNICLNAMVSVDFNMAMKASSFAGNVLFFSAGTNNEPATTTPKLVNLSSEVDLQLNENNLVIRNSSVPADFAPNTWYRVILLDGIQSVEFIDVLGDDTEFNRPLLATRPCEIDLDSDGDVGVGGNGKPDGSDATVYCFDFKTGPAGSKCVLKSVGVKPDNYTVDTLGPVISKQTNEDLVYQVWGRGDQECSMLSVDGMGWNWWAYDMPSGSSAVNASVAGQGPGLKDIFATSVALKEPVAPNLSVRLQTSAISSGQTITGSSTLYINLGPPKVTAYWPSCGEACINAVIGAKFNRMMDPSSYIGNIKLFECPSENACITAIANNSTVGFSSVAINILPEYVANRFEIQLAPTETLERNTSYLVYFTSDIYSVGQVTSDNNIVRQGERLEQKMWQFKTKTSGGFCIADKVITEPDPFTAYFIGEKTRYISSPFTNPDACSPSGQALNAWDFGWNWSSNDNNVAITSNFATAGQVKSFCNYGCLPKGSNLALGSYNKLNDEPFLCGNGRVDPGEDCDVGSVGEVVGTSCSLDCQRPGNTIISCGNGTVEINLGEECDKGDPATKIGCAENCTHLGSTDDSTKAAVGQPLCGSGAVTVGEDCEPGMNGAILNVTCASNCLNMGTKIAQSWCDANLGSQNTPECRTALSACGNNILEKGEECEVNGNIVKMFVDNNFDATYQFIASTNAVALSYCSSNCLLQNVCNTTIVGNTELACDSNTEGCNPDCTLHGSSVDEYFTPSLCGDGVIGAGEFSQCEYTGTELANFKIPGGNPIQAVTAVGEGTLDPDTQSQNTQVISKIVRVRGETQDLNSTQQAQLTSNSDYALQCGFKEFNTNVSPFNDCHDGVGGLTQGVGYNSCCYERPHRILPVLATDLSKYYPLDGSGFSGGPDGAVCRNTAIYVTFNGDIDEATLVNNLILAKGYAASTGVSCDPDNKTTDTIMATLAYNDQNNSLENNDGIWNNILNSIKKIFAWVIEKVKASIVSDGASDMDIETWCKTDLAGVPEAIKIKDISGNVVETRVNVYLSDMLDATSTYAVFMRGGKTGIKDIKGVGIKNPVVTATSLDDSFVFKTGADICRISKINIIPSRFVFTAPAISQTFSASVQSVNGKLINPIAGVYSWNWSWRPSSDSIFDIPNVSSTNNTIVSKNLEGKRIGHAYATVTDDLSAQNNQKGQIFTGNTDLTAIFCENPWPSVNYYPYEDGVSVGSVGPNNDGTDGSGVFNGSIIPGADTSPFNFKFAYCADAGKQANKADDLPYLRPFVFSDNFPDADTLKKFLFFSNLNNDVIGIQVFKNTERDSVTDWFRKRLGDPVGFKSVSIDGYDALTDDSNYYVDALNIISSGAVYNNIYLISINKDAQEDTKKVFEKIINSLEFNINFLDEKYCEDGPEVACTSDFDCRDKNGAALPELTGLCLAEKTKMRRDWQRIVTLVDIQEKLKNYTSNSTKPAPKLSSGTYLPGKTTSVWPSWGNLASQVGSLGVDPLNKWTSCNYCSNDTIPPLTVCSSDEECSTGNTCVAVDSQTCWDDINNRFICPARSNIIGYQLQDNDDYTVYSPLEFFSIGQAAVLLDTNNNHFVSGDALCAGGAGTVISGTSGVCGNGIVNLGEDCDPPGQSYVFNDVCDITPGFGGGLQVKRCEANCKYGTSVCQKLSTCGNGKKEPGEICDEGTLNGTYGHCNILCLGFSSQYCGNNTIDKHCSVSGLDCSSLNCAQNICTAARVCSLTSTLCVDNNSCQGNVCVPLEVCDAGVSNGLYNFNGMGCSESCQSAGPRCGDGILQSADGETCDDGNSTPQDGCTNCISDPVVTPTAGTTVPTGCGDGIINNNEACDRGNNNGITCTPKYGERCNYCSYDCGEILYVEPIGFCGNKGIDVISTDSLGKKTYEACELIPKECHGTNDTNCFGPYIMHGSNEALTLVDQCQLNPSIWDSTPTELKYTVQTGEYKCTNSCTNYETACITCGNAKIADGGTRAKVSVINPMIGVDKKDEDWFKTLFAKFYMRQNNNVHIGSASEIDFSSAVSPKDIFHITTVPDQGILTNPMCNDSYYMCFNQDGITGNCLETTDLPSPYLWPYSVKGESTSVLNEYIVSPNPPVGTVRVVLKWTSKDRTLLSNGDFGLGIISGVVADTETRYLDPSVEPFRCDVIRRDTGNNNYWIPGRTFGAATFPCARWPTSTNDYQGVYMHSATSTPTTYVQAMTINLYNSTTPVNDSFIEDAPFAIFVEAQSGKGMPVPMNTLLNSEAEVLIFEHHDVSGSSAEADMVFQPDYSFKIKSAQRSSNPSARFWQVFNLKRNDDSTKGNYYGYDVEAVQKVKTDTASLISGAYNP